MHQLDYSVAEGDVGSWEYLARERLKVLEPFIKAKAEEIDYNLLGGEASLDIDTRAIPLNSHYRIWKPTVYSVLFNKIT